MTENEWQIQNREKGIEAHEKMILIFQMQMDRSKSVFERSSLAGNIDYHHRMIKKLTDELNTLKQS